MARYKPAQTIRFTYNHPHEGIDEATGDKFKEVFVLNPLWGGMLHAIDLKRLTEAERVVLQEVFNPDNIGLGKKHKLPLVNDILRRMNPIKEVKNPHSFYFKFVKQFLKNKDAYRKYEPIRMLNVTIVRQTKVKGNVVNPKPLFHKVESKPPDQAKLDMIARVAAQMGVKPSTKAGQPLSPKELAAAKKKKK